MAEILVCVWGDWDEMLSLSWGVGDTKEVKAGARNSVQGGQRTRPQETEPGAPPAEPGPRQGVKTQAEAWGLPPPATPPPARP